MGLLLAMTILTACGLSPANTTDETRCRMSGGEWKEFASSCADTCSFARNQTQLCAQVLTMSCECGPERCWNGTYCTDVRDT